MKRRILPFTLLFVCIHCCTAQIFVDSAAVDGGDGSSWPAAFNKLQDALANAVAGEEIQVAKGTYKPDAPNGDPAATFLINKNLKLLGGYDASTGNCAPEMYETILSCDLNGDDVEDDFVMHRADNVTTVLTIGGNITNSTVIDGFTIRNGHAVDSNNNSEANGGGIYSDGAPVIRNCHFTQNHAFATGGALYQFEHTGQSLMIEGCTFEKNVANFGGAINIYNAPYAITGCSFINNWNISSVGTGAGRAIRIGNGNGYIQNCLFENNMANKNGGAMECWTSNVFSGSSTLISECVFRNNNSLGSSGAVGLNAAGNNITYSITGCEFEDNESATGFGALGLYSTPTASNANFLIDDCIFNQNSSGYGGSGMGCNISGNNTSLTLKNAAFNENQAGFHGVVSIFGGSTGNGDVTIDSCHFERNSAAWGGALELSGRQNSNVDFTVRNSTFIHNDADEGGAMNFWSEPDASTHISIQGCVIDSNKATILGGGISFNASSSDFYAEVSHSHISHNESPDGAAVDQYHFLGGVPIPGEAAVIFDNCLITGNTSNNPVISIDKMPGLKLVN